MLDFDLFYQLNTKIYAVVFFIILVDHYFSYEFIQLIIFNWSSSIAKSSWSVCWFRVRYHSWSTSRSKLSSLPVRVMTSLSDKTSSNLVRLFLWKNRNLTLSLFIVVFSLNQSLYVTPLDIEINLRFYILYKIYILPNQLILQLTQYSLGLVLQELHATHPQMKKIRLSTQVQSAQQKVHKWNSGVHTIYIVFFL